MAKVSFFLKLVILQGQVHKVKMFGFHGKVLSQGMYICNMKALPLLIRKLWSRLKVFKKEVKCQGQGHKVKNFGTHGKVFSQGIYICNMNVLPLLVRKLWPRLKFFKSRSNFRVKVTRSKFVEPMKRSCHKECTYEI